MEAVIQRARDKVLSTPIGDLRRLGLFEDARTLTTKDSSAEERRAAAMRIDKRLADFPS